MAGPYPPAVERWRPVVQRYFQPQDVDKALHVINYESGGNPDIPGDGGHAIGLFQHNSFGLASGRSLDALRDPEANIRLAAEAVYGGQGWRPWGENNLYKGQPFGALGRHPYNNPVSNQVSYTPRKATTAMPTEEDVIRFAEAMGYTVEEARRIMTGGSSSAAPQTPATPATPAPSQDTGKLPSWAVVKGGNLAVGTDPADGKTYQWEFNPSTYVDPVTRRIVPQGWNPRGTPDAPAQPTDRNVSIRVNPTTGQAFKVDYQGNIIGPAPEFNQRPTQAGNTRPPSPLERSAQAYSNASRAFQGGAPSQGVNLAEPAPLTETAPLAAPVNPRNPTLLTGREPIVTDFYGTPVSARIDNGVGGIQYIPLNSSNTRQDLAMFGLTPTGRPEADAETALASRAWIADRLAGGTSQRPQSVGEITAALDYYRSRNTAREDRISAGDLQAILEPESRPTDFGLPPQNPVVVDSYARPDEEEDPTMFATGGSIYTGGDDSSRIDGGTDFTSRRSATRGLLPNLPQPYQDDINNQGEFRSDLGKWFSEGARGSPRNVWDSYGPGWERAVSRWRGDAIEPTRLQGGRYAMPFRWDMGTPPPPGPTPWGGAGSNSYIPGFAGGGSIAVDEPITGVGMYSGEPRFTMGEPNALTGGAPTREVMNVTPLEPSVPMGMNQPAQPQQTPNDIAVLANVVHMMMGRRGKKAAYSPAPLGGS